MNHQPSITFTGIYIENRNHVYVSSINEELEEQKMNHAVIYRWLNGSWAQKPVFASISGMVGIESEKFSLLNMGINGEVTEFTFPGERTEYVDQSPEGPSSLVHLRCIRKIANTIVVAGMTRRVYKRERANQWIAIDEDVYVPRSERTTSVGFNSIDGISAGDIYAVGYQGEIWHLKETQWRKEVSPTNLSLNVVRIFSDNTVYAAGMLGTILKRDDSKWKVIQQNLTSKDFLGIAVFQGNVYFSNFDGVFMLDSECLTMVDMGFSVPKTTAYLDSNDEVIWSVGEKHLLYSENGINWHEVHPSV